MRKFYLLICLVIVQLVTYGQNRTFANVKSSANRTILSLIAAESNDSGSSAGSIPNVTTPTLPATGLSKGDLAVIGMNGDVDAAGSTIRSFAIVALNTIAANEVIFITDRGWINTYGSTPGHFVGALTTPRPSSTTTNEGILQWIPSVTIPAGTIIIFKIDLANRQVLATKGDGSSLPSADFSILSDSWTNTNLVANPWPSSVGDQLIIYQGSESSPSFIFAFNNIRVNGATTSNGWHINPNVVEPPTQLPLYSELPSDLGATYSIAFLTTTADSRYPNEKYNPSLSSGSKTTWLADITNTANWVNPTTSGTAYNFSLGFGSTAMTQFQVGSLAAPVVTGNPPNRTICLGGSTTFPATVTNATSYQWQENSGSGFVNITNGGVYSNATTATLTITGATAGMSGYTYNLVATGAGGSATSNAATLTVINITATTSQTNVSCNGGSNGAINLTPAGGTSPYTFNWGGGITTEDRTGLAAGTYTVIITDANGCTATVNATVTQPATAVSGTTVVTNISCNGGSNGSINLTPAGGASPYTFNWGGGITTEDRTGLAAGTYTVIITDANGCTATVNATVTQPATAVSGTTVVTNIACNGGSTGAINLTPAGGTSPYTFNWGGGITTEDRTGLAAGTYTVIITDANGCTATVNATVTQPATAVSGTTVVTNISCNGGSNGSINLTPAGGASPYTFNWGGGITTEDRTGLAAGTYTVIITDANGCTATVNATVTQPATAVSGTTVVTNISCNGGSNGSINLTPAGGTSPYTFNWGGGITTEDRTGLAAGTYTVIITDANGCTATVNATVTQPNALAATVSQTNVSCNGGTNGTATINVTGGTSPYNYSWSPSGGTGSTANNLAAGTYTVTVTDANSCSLTRTVTITQSAAVAAPTGTAIQSFNAGDTLSALVVNGQSIKWYASQSNATNHTSSLPLTTPIVNNTTYYATQTSGACESTASLAVLAYNPTLSVGSVIKTTAGLQIYPNPVSDILKISGEERISKFVISSLDGRKITEKILRDGERGINVSSLVQGTYLIQVFTKNQVKTFKFIKK